MQIKHTDQQPINSPWMTITEAAEYLKLNRRTLQNYIYRGLIPVCISPSNTKRFLKNDLDKWMMGKRRI